MPIKEILMTIVIPVYNVEKYIKKCLNSIISECDEDIELIIINDGTKDMSMAVVEGLTADMENVIIINQENKGLSAARNAGMLRASGEYIFFIDSDDYLIQDSIVKIKKSLLNLNRKVDFLSIGYELVTGGDSETNITRCNSNSESQMYNSDNIGEVIAQIKKPLSAAWRYVVKKDFLLQYNIMFREGMLCEDIEWCTKLFYYSAYIGHLDDGLYQYRFSREGSIMGTVSDKRVHDAIIGINNAYDIINKQGKDKRSRLLKKYLLNQLLYNWSFATDVKSEEVLLDIKKRIGQILKKEHHLISCVVNCIDFRYTAKLLKRVRIR